MYLFLYIFLIYIFSWYSILSVLSKFSCSIFNLKTCNSPLPLIGKNRRMWNYLQWAWANVPLHEELDASGSGPVSIPILAERQNPPNHTLKFKN